MGLFQIRASQASLSAVPVYKNHGVLFLIR